MTKVYEQFDKAFSQVSAYVVMRDGKLVGKIAIKYPKDGAGRLHVFVHQYGFVMITGFAGGCGYDKVGAALADAYSKRFKDESEKVDLYEDLSDITYNGNWQRDLESKGYQIISAI